MRDHAGMDHHEPDRSDTTPDGPHETPASETRASETLGLEGGLPPGKPPRVSDGVALGLLGGWLVFRAITQRVGLGLTPRLLGPFPWVIPLLNNSMLVVIATGTGIQGRPWMFVATGAASVFLATISGLVLYWAGYRFGPKLAEKGARSRSIWGQIWNPKQVAKAHRWIERWGVFAVFLGRTMEWFTAPVMVVAGATRMSFGKFLAAHTAGAMAFASVTLWIGVAADRRWPGLKDRIVDLSPWALRVAIILLVVFAVSALLSRREGRRDPEREPERGADGEPER